MNESVANTEISQGLKWSFMAHIAFALFIIFQSVFFPHNSTIFIPTLKVDIVDLPDLLKNEMGKSKPQPDETMSRALEKAERAAKKIKLEKVIEQAKPDEMVLKPKMENTQEKEEHTLEKRMKASLARMKSLAKISADEKPMPDVPLKGNKISKGSSVSGDARESNVASYFDSIRDRLQENWALPVWLARQNLSAQVDIYIDSRGNIRSFRFTRISGNPHFDDAVKKTIAQSAPFPAPPADLAATLLINGISLGFPL